VRTLFEIVEGAKDGNKPTHEECYYALLALSALHYFDHHEIMNIHEAAEGNKPSLLLRIKGAFPESFNRFKRALDKDPREWLGKNVPEDPEYQKMRGLAFKVAERATGVDLRS
jgi:hypothetical protein